LNADAGHSLAVLLTFDVEVWCGGWQHLDRRFPSAFRRYVYGTSPAGNYALPKTLEILNAHGLKGVFFVEPLFAARFGVEYLAEIVALIQGAGQDVQLHLHPEWQDEARTPVIADCKTKRQHLFMYDVDEQTALIEEGRRLLTDAGVNTVSAFRAGSFACNGDTFIALARNGLRYDSSLDTTMPHSGADLSADARRMGCHTIDGIMEIPLSVARGCNGALRHMQVGACSYEEIERSLHCALRSGWRYFNILSHSFELLTPDSSRPDPVVVKRFASLCEFLHNHRHLFPTTDFSGELEFGVEPSDLKMPETSCYATWKRQLEQAYRRVRAAYVKRILERTTH
jgi:hypothetical protein